jgi:hypothetical protein
VDLKPIAGHWPVFMGPLCWSVVFAATLLIFLWPIQYGRRAVDLKPITGYWSVFIGPLCWSMVFATILLIFLWPKQYDFNRVVSA